MTMQHQFINDGDAALIPGRPGVLYEERTGAQRMYRWVNGAMEEIGAGTGSGGYLNTVADEAAMVALTAAVAGSEVYRTDTSSYWKLREAPYSTAGNWDELGAASEVGTLPQFGAIRAITDWNKYSVTADALLISGPCIVKGFRCLTGTSIVGVYDALSAAGTNLMPSVTTAANTEYMLAGEGGVLFSTGLYVDWGSGTYVFYALPVEA
jgi:hypothetical protein